ncbi:MAG TPA: penicillin acylase family protein [Blastocatellia bacterium]|nr:penicillin acylase family protein [Blastocatellia bacterium]
MKRTSIIVTTILIIASLANLSFPQQKPDKKTKFTRQTITVDGEEVTIIRDDFGVPHIFARTERGVYFGGGYAVAQDRLFQMERYRRDARGQVAEIEGAQAVQRDQQVRMIGYTEEQLQSFFDSLSDEMKRTFQAYADGVNAYIKEAIEQKKVPEQFARAGISEPAPWKVTDSVAIGILMAHRFGSGGGSENFNAQILKFLQSKFGADAEKVFNDLFWINDPKSPTTVPDEEKTEGVAPANGKKGVALDFRSLSDNALAQAEAVSDQTAVYQYNGAHNLPTKWGSYAWVISPRRSVTGNAMIVGGPQMGFSTPQIAHEIHYSTGDLNVIGMGFAGVPEVLIGHNDHLAWTTTSGITDMVDIFAEKLNPQDKHQYFYKGQWRDMQKRVETINVKGGEPVKLEIYRTVHGPIVAWDEKAGIAYSRAASFAGKELSNIAAFHGFNRAKTIQEFAKHCESIFTNHNFFVATATGDIGYWHCGKPPIRAKGQDPRLPTPGTGEMDWTGLVPFSKMPQMINPKQGFIVNWNNKPAKWWDNGDRPAWGEIFRIHRIDKLIRAQDKMTFEQVRDITRDIGTNDPNADYLKPYLLAAIEKTGAASKDARVNEATAYLRAWDNHAIDGSVAKTIFDAWLQAAREAIFADEFKELDSIGALAGQRNFFNQLIQPSMILHAIEGAKSGVPPSRDYFNGKNKDEVLVEALRKAIDDLSKKRGPQMNLWTYSQGEIDFKPLPGIIATNRGTYIQAIELSKPIFRSVNILPPGQSEDPRSPHYNDQREMAGYWRFKPMIYKRDLLERAFATEQAAGSN